MVYALNLTTGAKLWVASLGSYGGVPNESLATAALDGTNLVVGDAVGVYDLNAVTGAPIAGNAVLATTSSGLVEGVRTNGSIVWGYATGGRLLRPPALVDGTFFAAGLRGTFWAFTPYGAPPP